MGFPGFAPPQGSSDGAPVSSNYVVTSTDATLNNERVLTAGTGVTLTDAGAGGNLTLDNTALSMAYWVQPGTGGVGRRYYLCGVVQSGQNVSGLTETVTLGQLYAAPFVIPRSGLTVVRIGFAVNSAAAAGGVGRCGIYTNTSSTVFYPDALVVDSDEFATDSTGGKEATVSASITSPGLYWYVTLFGTSACGIARQATSLDGPWLGWASITASNGFVNRIIKAQTYGALPATFPASATNNNSVPMHCVWVSYD